MIRPVFDTALSPADEAIVDAVAAGLLTWPEDASRSPLDQLAGEIAALDATIAAAQAAGELPAALPEIDAADRRIIAEAERLARVLDYIGDNAETIAAILARGE